jgi:ketosteroid isomerase-like protein
MDGQQKTAESAVREAEQKRCDALMTNDKAALESIYADDFVYVHSSGRVEERSSYLNSVTTGENKFLSFAHEDLRIELLGDAALMTGTMRMTRTKSKLVVLFAELWVRENGEWRLKYQHNTKKAGEN